MVFLRLTVKGNIDVNDVSLDPHEAPEQIGSAEIQLIQLLHPRTDGFVAFAVGDEDTWVSKIAIRSDTLPEEIPSFTRDSYVSINQAFRVKRFSDPSHTRGKPLHRAATLGYLCAAC